MDMPPWPFATTAAWPTVKKIADFVSECTVMCSRPAKLALYAVVRCKVLVEPSGAAALAVVLRERLPESPRNVGVLLSGGNVDPATVVSLLQRHGASS